MLLDGAPEQLAELARTANVVVVAYEPAPSHPRTPIPGVQLTQTFWAEIGNGELEVARAAQILGDGYLARVEGPTDSASLRERGVTRLNGVEVARVEVASNELHLIGYAIPLGSRFGLLSYTCTPSECERLRPEFQRAVAAMVGAAPKYLASLAHARDLAVAGVILLFASAALGMEAITAVVRRRSG